MKGIRFYLEYESPRAKRENRNNGNVIAIFGTYEEGTVSGQYLLRGIGASSCPPRPNMDVQEWSFSKSFIKGRTTKIEEPIARIIHPKLFEVLDNLNKTNHGN